MKEKVFFENSKGNRLCGILSNPTGNKGKPIIILCHSFSSNKGSTTNIRLERSLNINDSSTFRFDFYGHGESEGNFEDITISEGVDDVLSAVRFLKEQGYAVFGLMGSSFGGMAALVAAASMDHLHMLVLKGPVSDYLGKLISQITRYPVEEWKKKGFIYYTSGDGRKLKLNYSFFEDAEAIHGYDAAAKIKSPTLIVHGSQDQSVPLEQSQKTARLIKNCTLKVIEGADHAFSRPEHFEEMLNAISTFILKNSTGYSA